MTDSSGIASGSVQLELTDGATGSSNPSFVAAGAGLSVSTGSQPQEQAEEAKFTSCKKGALVVLGAAIGACAVIAIGLGIGLSGGGNDDSEQELDFGNSTASMNGTVANVTSSGYTGDYTTQMAFEEATTTLGNYALSLASGAWAVTSTAFGEASSRVTGFFSGYMNETGTEGYNSTSYNTTGDYNSTSYNTTESYSSVNDVTTELYTIATSESAMGTTSTASTAAPEVTTSTASTTASTANGMEETTSTASTAAPEVTTSTASTTAPEVTTSTASTAAPEVTTSTASTTASRMEETTSTRVVATGTAEATLPGGGGEGTFTPPEGGTGGTFPPNPRSTSTTASEVTGSTSSTSAPVVTGSTRVVATGTVEVTLPGGIGEGTFTPPEGGTGRTLPPVISPTASTASEVTGSTSSTSAPVVTGSTSSTTASVVTGSTSSTTASEVATGSPASTISAQDGIVTSVSDSVVTAEEYTGPSLPGGNGERNSRSITSTVSAQGVTTATPVVMGSTVNAQNVTTATPVVTTVGTGSTASTISAENGNVTSVSDSVVTAEDYTGPSLPGGSGERNTTSQSVGRFIRGIADSSFANSVMDLKTYLPDEQQMQALKVVAAVVPATITVAAVAYKAITLGRSQAINPKAKDNDPSMMV